MKNKIIKSIKSKVVDVASDVLSAPSRAVSKVKATLADDKFRMLKKQNQEKALLKEMDKSGVKDAGNESDPLFRHRINTINEAFDREHERRSKL